MKLKMINILKEYFKAPDKEHIAVDASNHLEVKVRNWYETGKVCPKCKSRMIHNHTGHECAGLNCDYNADQGKIEK